MTTFKEGSQVKIIGKDQQGIILGLEPGFGRQWIVTHLDKEGKKDRQGHLYYPRELELLPQTQELTLENVYIYAPQRELKEVLWEKAKKKFPESVFSNTSKDVDYIFFTKDPYHTFVGPRLNSTTGPDADSLKGKQEVSIPQFLDLLTSYSQRKKEVKVQLNTNLVATVEEGNEVVALDLNEGQGRDLYAVTRKEILDFQHTLKGGGHGFERGDTLYLTDPDLTHTLSKYAKKKGVKVAKDTDQEANPSLVYVSGELGTCAGQGFNSLEKKVLTIDQFLAKCQSSPLPKLAEYEVQVFKPNTYQYNKETLLKVGCQWIELTQFEALMEAITTTK